MLAAGVLVSCGVFALAQNAAYQLGKPATEEEIRAWDISVGPAGKELPAGGGSAKEGAKLYAQKCAACHGPMGQGTKLAPQLAGTKNERVRPERTVGSYWPFATTIWDYINRAMPLKQEGSLKPDEVYALTAFLLFRNDIIQESDVMDAHSLPKVAMPNRNGFVPARPEDIRLPRCRLGTCP